MSACHCDKIPLNSANLFPSAAFDATPVSGRFSVVSQHSRGTPDTPPPPRHSLGQLRSLWRNGFHFQFFSSSASRTLTPTCTCRQSGDVNIENNRVLRATRSPLLRSPTPEHAPENTHSLRSSCQFGAALTELSGSVECDFCKLLRLLMRPRRSIISEKIAAHIWPQRCTPFPTGSTIHL